MIDFQKWVCLENLLIEILENKLDIYFLTKRYIKNNIIIIKYVLGSWVVSKIARRRQIVGQANKGYANSPVQIPVHLIGLKMKFINRIFSFRKFRYSARRGKSQTQHKRRGKERRQSYMYDSGERVDQVEASNLENLHF